MKISNRLYVGRVWWLSGQGVSLKTVKNTFVDKRNDSNDNSVSVSIYIIYTQENI